MNKFRSTMQSGKTARLSNPLIADKQARGATGDDLTSIPVERHEPRTADHRDGDRHRLTAEQIHLTVAGKDLDAELINLSGGGAMIRADFSPRLWDRVDLHLGTGSPLECAVRWIRGDRVGLEFAHETQINCSPEQRDAMLLDVIQRTFPDVAAVPAPESQTAEPREPVDTTRRAERRHPLIWSGQLLYNHDAHPVRLRNISTTGALVDGTTPLPEGVEVMLDLGQGVHQFATVSWNRGEQSGLAFTSPFDLARLAEAKPEIAPQRWVRPGFLDLAPSQDSPWAEEWDRPTIEQLRGDLEGYLKY